MEQTTETKDFSNGNKPVPADFTITKIIPATTDPDTGEEIPEKTETENLAVIDGTDTKGNLVKYVLLSNGSIARIMEGEGTAFEKAMMESSNNQSKYLTSMMAACVSIDDKPVNMYQLAKLKLKDYIRIQVPFSQLNF